MENTYIYIDDIPSEGTERNHKEWEDRGIKSYLYTNR